ncbi:Thiolase-like protein [Novymonas esmeraldas]|uniref:Thiolase-like protein n=1 Tax=Novymonas esmeraldas TaxID=1808958 RepID=A0AAW0ES83_9TRYP
MSATKIVIVGAARTPVGAVGGGLASLTPRELMLLAAKAALTNGKCDPQHVEYTSVGQGMQDMRSMNIAKVTSEFMGAPITSPATTVQENCASGGAAIHDIARRIVCGEVGLGLAGGVESMSTIPRLLFAGRAKGQIYGDMTLVDGLQGALFDPTVGKKGMVMGLLTEAMVEKYKLSRELQDEIAYRSHKNAWESWEKGLFDYVTPVEVAAKKKSVIVSRDEGPRQLEASYFAAQAPHFKRDGTGTITVANASSVNDGAAAVVLASEKRAKELGLPILAELKAWGNVGVPKEYMAEGAFKVLPKLFGKADVKLGDVDYFDMNEAFAAVVGAATKEFPELNLDKVNQWGSGVSIGHPVGCTGARQVVDMCYQLRRRDGRTGVTSRCVGGGIGSGEVIIRYE